MMLMAFTASAAAQQDHTANGTFSIPPMAELGNVSSATVTLYYYDNADGEKGAMVPMSDNPQQVAWDASRSAPGMYTFSKVPTDQWYYLEANNNGDTWYTVFYMAQGQGTHTANVNIPPFQPLNNSSVSTTPAPSAAPAAMPSTAVNTPAPTAAKPQPTPAPTGIVTIVALTATVLLLLKKH
jgi:hypothetical protein